MITQLKNISIYIHRLHVFRQKLYCLVLLDYIRPHRDREVKHTWNTSCIDKNIKFNVTFIYTHIVLLIAHIYLLYTYITMYTYSLVDCNHNCLLYLYIYICLNYICTFCYVIEFAQVRLADQMFMVNNSVAQLATIEAALDAFDKWQLLNLTVCIIKPFISIYIYTCVNLKRIYVYI